MKLIIFSKAKVIQRLWPNLKEESSGAYAINHDDWLSFVVEIFLALGSCPFV